MRSFALLLSFLCPIALAHEGAAPPKLSKQSRLKASELQGALCPFRAERAKRVFAPALLADIPPAELARLFEERSRSYGRCTELKRDGERWILRSPEADLPLELGFEAKTGLIADFTFGAPEVKDDSFAKVVAVGKRAFPRFSFYVESDGREVFSYGKEAALNVGRSSQLFLLAALRKKVAAKQLSLDQSVPLDPALLRYSFGLLRQWPAGTSLTLDSLKSLAMIEMDTAAADHLLQAVGREALEAEAPLSKPYLSFQELHALVFRAKPAELKDRSGWPKLAARLLAAPEPEAIPGRAELVEKVGWFAGTEALCGALRGLKDEPVLRRTMASEGASRLREDDWQRVIVLSARDAGLAQSTFLLQAKKGGQWSCLSLTANDPGGVIEGTVLDLTDRILRLISFGAEAKN